MFHSKGSQWTLLTSALSSQLRHNQYVLLHSSFDSYRLELLKLASTASARKFAYWHLIKCWFWPLSQLLRKTYLNPFPILPNIYTIINWWRVMCWMIWKWYRKPCSLPRRLYKVHYLLQAWCLLKDYTIISVYPLKSQAIYLQCHQVSCAYIYFFFQFYLIIPAIEWCIDSYKMLIFPQTLQGLYLLKRRKHATTVWPLNSVNPLVILVQSPHIVSICPESFLKS